MSVFGKKRHSQNVPSLVPFFIIFSLFFSVIIAQSIAYQENNSWSYALLFYSLSIFSLALSSKGNFSYYYNVTVPSNHLNNLLRFPTDTPFPYRMYIERLFFLGYTVLGLIGVSSIYIYSYTTNQTELLYIQQFLQIHYILIWLPIAAQLVFELCMITLEEIKSKKQQKSAK